MRPVWCAHGRNFNPQTASATVQLPSHKICWPFTVDPSSQLDETIVHLWGWLWAAVKCECLCHVSHDVSVSSILPAPVLTRRECIWCMSLISGYELQVVLFFIYVAYISTCESLRKSHSELPVLLYSSGSWLWYCCIILYIMRDNQRLYSVGYTSPLWGCEKICSVL